MTQTDLALIAAAWDQLHAVVPPGWQVGRPYYHSERRQWLLYAFDPREVPRSGKRACEWLAVAPTESAVVMEMARCLEELREGRWPK